MLLINRKKKLQKQKEAYDKALKLFAGKIHWINKNKNRQVILINVFDPTDLEILNDLTSHLNQKTNIIHLDKQNENEDITWAEGLNIVYSSNFCQNPLQYSIAPFVQAAILFIKYSSTRKTNITKTIEKMKNLDIPVEGTVLFSYREKIPQMIKKGLC